MANVATYERLRNLAGLKPEELNDEELDVYLEESQVTDDEGRYPDDDDYLVTYDLHRAAARIFWDRAAEVARTAMTVQADQTRVERQHIMDNYVRLARWHERRAKPRLARLSSYPIDKAQEPVDNVSADA